jgi:hypothetical protein
MGFLGKLNMILLLVLIVLYIVVLAQVNKVKKDNDIVAQNMGPPAGHEVVDNPSPDWIQGCKDTFDKLPKQNNTRGVCGAWDEKGDARIGTEDMTNMNDNTCFNNFRFEENAVVAYTKEQCDRPFRLDKQGSYLCGGGNMIKIEGAGGPGSSGEVRACPAPVGKTDQRAPENPWGCEFICR